MRTDKEDRDERDERGNDKGDDNGAMSGEEDGAGCFRRRRVTGMRGEFSVTDFVFGWGSTVRQTDLMQ
jgi:hypothetical protein